MICNVKIQVKLEYDCGLVEGKDMEEIVKQVKSNHMFQHANSIKETIILTQEDGTQKEIIVPPDEIL